jgi:outer membrane protein assembly factor BamB
VADLLVLAHGERLTAVDMTRGEVRWTHQAPVDVTPPAAARSGSRDLVLLGAGQGLYLLDAASGERARAAAIAFEAELAGRPAFGGSAREPKAFVPLVDGVAAVDLSSDGGVISGELLWARAQVPTGALVPSRAAEAVLVPVGARLLSLAEGSGDPLGTLQPGLNEIVGTATSAERVTVLGRNGFMLALSAYNGEKLWAGARVAKGASAGPLQLDGDLVVADAEGRLLRLSPTGKARETAPIVLGGPVAHLVAARGQQVLAVQGKVLHLADLTVR